MTSFKCEATVLFCDIRNFTVLFENADPCKAVEFANVVLAVLGNQVELNGGTVDRFTGDGFLAHFGVHNSAGNHSEAACQSVLDMRNKLSEINANRYHNKELVVNTGIGMHTGQVAIGQITTGNVTQTTILGDTVNTASRIEGLTKYFSVDALVSEASWMKVKEQFKFQKMPLKKVKGKEQMVQSYWLLPTNRK